MANVAKGLYRDENGKVSATAALSREKLRREQGYTADASYDDAFSQMGWKNTSSTELLKNSAQLIESPGTNKSGVAQDAQSRVIDKISSGENPYYDAANDMSAPTYTSQYDSTINELISKILNGKNSYYDAADSMEKPAYESAYGDDISRLLDTILNGADFSYDINADAAYQQYKDIYERSAKKSSQDAMSDAMSASGGYANSYAQAAAQQAYNAQMQDVGAAIADYEANAYNRFLTERQDDYSKLSSLMSAEDMRYGQYRDSVSDYYADRDYQLAMGDRYADDLQTQYGVISDSESRDYGQYQDSLSQFNTDRDYQLAMGDRYSENLYNQAALYQSIEEFEFNKEQYLNDSEYQKAVAAAELGDYSLLGNYLGIDTTEAQKFHNITQAAELYSATGMISFLKNAGLDTTDLEEQMQDEAFYNKLTTGLAIYEATGDSSQLKALGIDTAYSDKLLNYTLIAAQNDANGSTGSGGDGKKGDNSGDDDVIKGDNLVISQTQIDKAISLFKSDESAFNSYIEQLEKAGYSQDDVNAVIEAAYDALLSDEEWLKLSEAAATVLDIADGNANLNYTSPIKITALK